jgi:hypothetical protein
LLHLSYNVPYPDTYLHDGENPIHFGGFYKGAPGHHFRPKLQFRGALKFLHAVDFPTLQYNLYTMGAFAVAICAVSWTLVMFAGASPASPRSWAKKAASWLPIALFLAHPLVLCVIFGCFEVKGNRWRELSRRKFHQLC